jgi:hypothetical protein
MITRKDTPAYAAVAVIQDAIARAFAGKIGLANINATAGSSIAHELRAGQIIPRNLALDFSPLLDILHLPQLGGNKDDAGARSIKDMVDGTLSILVDPADAIRQIFDNNDPGAIFGRMMDFFESQPPIADVVSTLGSFLEGQFGIALTLVTTLKNLADPSLPRTIADACLNYFFNPDGYVTVDEIHILPPMQFQGIPANVSDLTGLFSRRDAERYVRDLINVIVEGTGNVQYRLRDRYHLISSQFTGAQLDTAKRWFTGFGAMAEAGLTTAVEETLLGVGQFQVNRVVAAAAGAYAGTAARKMTQHVFLSELGIPV